MESKFFRKDTLLIFASLLIIIIAFSLSISTKQVKFIDDSWITFRYAHNLAYKGELTFNIGENVEGMTNLLFALLLALFTKILAIPIPVIAVWISFFLIGYSLYRIWKIGMLLKLNPLIATLPAVILIVSPDVYSTLTNGLETPLFTVLLLDSIYFFIKGRYSLSSIFLGLLFMTRPDSIGVGLLFLFTIAFELFGKNRKGVFIKSSLIYLGILLLTTGFRLIYYNDFLPNSVRDKSISLQGWVILSGVRYIMDFINHNPQFIIILMTSAILIFIELFKPNFHKGIITIFSSLHGRILTFCVLSIFFSFVVVIRNGGDWMPNYRLLLQYAGFYACLLILLLQKGTINFILTLAILFYPLIQTLDMAQQNIRSGSLTPLVSYDAGMPFWQEASSRLSTVLSPSDKISAEAIGFIGYGLMDNYIHDPIGLTDKYIAIHGIPSVPFGKTDIRYTVKTIKPSVMIWHYTGHLKDLDPSVIDQEYVTYCYENCKNWTAHVVMIRTDRVKDLSIPFRDWSIIKISSIQ